MQELKDKYCDGRECDRFNDFKLTEKEFGDDLNRLANAIAELKVKVKQQKNDILEERIFVYSKYYYYTKKLLEQARKVLVHVRRQPKKDKE